jgi:hypothetical protein
VKASEDAAHVQTLRNTEASVRAYWGSHPLGLQYATDPSIDVCTPELLEQTRHWMNPYKWPWIMGPIEQEARMLEGGVRLFNVAAGSAMTRSSS